MTNTDAITMPKEVFEAAEVLINEFMQADYWPRLKYFCEEAESDETYQKFADDLEAAAELYEAWRDVHEARTGRSSVTG